MRIDTLSPAPGATTKAKRLGGGIGSGLGKTSGKGHKGQWARSGGGVLFTSVTLILAIVRASLFAHDLFNGFPAKSGNLFRRL